MNLEELQKRAGITEASSREVGVFFKAAADLLRTLEYNPRALTPEDAGNLEGMAAQLASAARQAQGL